MGLNNLFCIYYVIIHASRSIDVCVPSLVSATLVECLLSVKRNRVNIRIILHAKKYLKNLEVFTQNEIDVKVIEHPERLEYNFILIDAEESYIEAVAVLGSIDYEPSRVNCIREANLITSQERLVNALKHEFERLWYAAN